MNYFLPVFVLTVIPVGVDDNPAPLRLSTTFLPNAVRVHSSVISGGTPKGSAGFAELESLGVTTLISVDGSKPSVELARRYGMNYIHLPHGYDGVSEQRVKELAKAVWRSEGPIYIHCHHGKHRSPVAAAVACLAAGLIERKDASRILKLAGTSPRYRGLHDAVRRVRPLGDEFLNEFRVDFKEVVDLPPMAGAMVAIEQTYGNLKHIATAGWSVPDDHPDLDPEHEALMLKEHFTELLRADYVALEPREFLSELRYSARSTERLERLLNKTKAGSPPVGETLREIREEFDAVSESCTQCHKRFRDDPRHRTR